jgi:hypothetical protein
MMITTHTDGSLRLYPVQNPERHMQIRPHDGNTKVRRAMMTFNENYVVSIGEDGTMFVTEFFKDQFMEAAESGSTAPPVLPDEPKKELGAGSLGLENKLPFHVPTTEDLADPDAYSL